MRAASSSAGDEAPAMALRASRSSAWTSTGRAYHRPSVGSDYDAIAEIYDAWSRSVTEDVSFYVEEALASGGPVVELGVGTGRIAVPVALAGVRVIEGDLRRPPVEERVPLVTAPFRSFLHLATDAERLEALAAVRGLLAPAGRFV